MKLFGKWTLSLRLVISLIIATISVVPTVIVSLVLINSAITSEIDTTSSEISGQVLILANQLYSEDYVDHYTTSEMTGIVQEMADIWGGRIQITNEAGKIIYDSYDVDTGRYNISEYVLSALSGTTTSNYDAASQQFAVAVPIQGTADEIADAEEAGEETPAKTDISGAILVNMDTQQMVTALSVLERQTSLLWMAVFCFAMLVIILVLVYVFKPFRRLISQMNGAFDGTVEKIDVHTYSETAKLSEAVNKTLKKLQAIDVTRREFVSNVSHELKTPITSVRVLADSLNTMEGAPIEMYKEFMQDISKALERESNTIDDLLSMVRLEESQVPLNISEIDMNFWLEDMLKSINPLAKMGGIDLNLESVRPVIASFDEPKMYRVITNLISNAIKYNRMGGWVKVTLDADYRHFIIKIADSGIGIPEEAIPHLFDRFYRVDKARSREAGGTGLGLSICKKIVNMHHGTIRVESEPGIGSTFIVKVPLEYRREEKEKDDEEISD